MKISSFSLLLIMAVLMVVGAATVPLLSVQYTPTIERKGVGLSFGWADASARLVEQEVTSKIEGLLAPIAGVEQINSVSRKGGGSVDISFKKGIAMEAIRFEVSAKMRQLYPSLPEGVSYPTLSTSMQGDQVRPILTYTINADLPTNRIEQTTQRMLADRLMRTDGVARVDVSGATPDEWVIEYDVAACGALGIQPQHLAKALFDNSATEEMGLVSTQDGKEQTRVVWRGVERPPERWGEVPVARIEDRVVLLGDVASIQRRQALPQYYYRVNGLNNINLSITPERGVNTLLLANRLKEQMDQLRGELPAGYQATLVDDSSQYVRSELNKIYLRSGLSLLVLLLFVLLVSHSWRYLILIATTLIANILIAVILYNLFQLQIHLYSLAGITVSLGLVIDTTLIMTDHYGRCGNRKVFVAILAALLTTIGALSVVLFLPEAQRANLVDFSAVVAINLAVSLVVSLFFVPAMLDRFPMRTLTRKRKGTKALRRNVRRLAGYGRWIRWSKRHKWVYVVVALLGFGIPLHLLPSKIGVDQRTQRLNDSLTRWEQTYNATIGGELYQNTIKAWLEPAFGGAMRLFAKQSFGGGNFWNEPERTRVYINAQLPDGCTVHQLNETMREMEAFLSDFEEIETFVTRISSYRNGSIVVSFKPEHERSSFPYQLKESATAKAIAFGGAVWGIYGVGQGFSNNISTGYKPYHIELTGYNYDQLYNLAEELLDSLVVNPRVKVPEIAGRTGWGQALPATEFFMAFDYDRFALYNLSPAAYYTAIEQQLYRQPLPRIHNRTEGKMEQAVLVSAQADRFDVWHLAHDPIAVDSQLVKLAGLGSIVARRVGNDIYKKEQQYTLTVSFDFVGSYELARRVVDQHCKRLEASLPTGFRVASDAQYGWWGADNGVPYALLLLVVAIIYLVCSVLFESLVQPLVIVLLIPLSFVGLFLTFWLFELPFDQGGFAAMVLLAGLVVNAGVYLIHEYNSLGRGVQQRGVGLYLRAYGRKIVPILLTILSTVLGLVPFVVLSREPFWFSFAAGAMGGMLFSVVAVVFFLPLFLPLRIKRKI